MFKLHMKDPGSAITHFIAMILSILAATPLLLKSYRDTGHFTINSLSLAIFIVSMILLYAASTTYHTLDISPKVNRILRKIDHMMIFVLIAGTYTPVCMVVLGDHTGGTCLGDRHCRDSDQSVLDHLPQVVLFHDLHCYGLGLRPGFW